MTETSPGVKQDCSGAHEQLVRMLFLTSSMTHTDQSPSNLPLSHG